MSDTLSDMSSTATFIRTPNEITSAWLATALDLPAVELISTEPIGTGQMSQSYRVRYAVDGTLASVVVKLASEDATSRATGVGMGAYFREVAFYRNLAGQIGGPLPACHLAEYDAEEGWFTLVLEDITGAEQGDQIAGCTVEDARTALVALARIHAPVLNNLSLSATDYLNQPNLLNQELLTALLPAFLQRYRDRIAPEHAEVCKRFVPVVDAWSAERHPPLGLVHGDFRLDNLLFADRTCRVVDWQTVTWGPAMTDAAYFIGCGLEPAERREHELDLVRAYHDELRAQGVEALSWEACWEGYRSATFHGILMTVAASMLVAQTDRGDDMFMTCLRRNAQQVLDLEALDLLPEPGAERPVPLQPRAEDEVVHAPGPEPMWSESWYFDAVTDAADLGVYTRIGRLPNQNVCMFTACICGPDRPSIMLHGYLPLPAQDDPLQIVDAPGVHAEHHCEEPLKRFRVVVEGTAGAHDDPAGPLRSEPGEPVEIAIDLTWETDGTPYAWRQSMRYEMPCRVTGTVRVRNEELTFAGPGQRDHSWGTRDWWSVGWMWNGLHLEDGTHTHAVGVPTMPGYGVGYVQRDGEVTEITTVNATEVVADDELVTSATVTSGPDELVMEIQPLAYGAARLEAPDGRLSFLPRAMCRVQTQDGRTGTGWIEWNRVGHEVS